MANVIALKKKTVTVNAASAAKVEDLWSRVNARRPAGCYLIRFVSSSDERTLEVMPSYEGWSSIMGENQIIPGVVGRRFVNYNLSGEDIKEFTVVRVEFLISEQEDELVLLDEEQYNPPYNSLEAREYLRDRSKEARRAKLVCREIGWLYAAMREVWFYHEIEDKLNLLMEGMATYDDFAHHPHDCFLMG